MRSLELKESVAEMPLLFNELRNTLTRANAALGGDGAPHLFHLEKAWGDHPADVELDAAIAQIAQIDAPANRHDSL